MLIAKYTVFFFLKYNIFYSIYRMFFKHTTRSQVLMFVQNWWMNRRLFLIFRGSLKIYLNHILKYTMYCIQSTTSGLSILVELVHKAKYLYRCLFFSEQWWTKTEIHIPPYYIFVHFSLAKFSYMVNIFSLLRTTVWIFDLEHTAKFLTIKLINLI